MKSSQMLEDMPNQGKNKTPWKGKAGVPPGIPLKRGRPKRK
jgi:hypothetical protein